MSVPKPQKRVYLADFRIHRGRSLVITRRGLLKKREVRRIRTPLIRGVIHSTPSNSGGYRFIPLSSNISQNLCTLGAIFHQAHSYFANFSTSRPDKLPAQVRSTVASETLEGMFLVNNSLNTQRRALKPLNECSFKFSLLTSTVLGVGAYGPHKDINLKSVICLFNIGP